MPPCEPLMTTAPAASLPIRVMLSAVRTGGSSLAGTGLSREVLLTHHAERSGRRTSRNTGAHCAATRRPPDTTIPSLNRDPSGRSALLADRVSAVGRLFSIVFPLLLAPGSAFLRIELAVMIGIDLIEAFAIELVAFFGRHRRQLIVIGLAPLDACFLCRGKTGRHQLPREPRLALLQIAYPEIAILVESDRFACRSGLGGALCGCGPMPPGGCQQCYSRGSERPSSHRPLPRNQCLCGDRTKHDHI